MAVLHRAGFRAVLVGGAVRDVLRGTTPHDWDVATSARPETVQRLFPDVAPTGLAHGTVTVTRAGNPIEVTTFRSEGAYVDGRRPASVEFHDSIELDLARRDFTFNAMAWSERDGLVDPFGGLEDLARGQVRSVREARLRFSEDGLRPVRAVRFATVLGFTLEASTEAAIAETLDVFRRVATERWRVEFDKLLLHAHASKGLELLARTGLLRVMLPEAGQSKLAHVSSAGTSVAERLAVLLSDHAKPRDAALRIKSTTAVADEVAALLVERSLPSSEANDAALRRWLASVGPARLDAVLRLHAAMGTSTPDVPGRLRAIAATRPPLSSRDLALDGKAILTALAVKPGKLVGEATRHLVDLVLEDPSKNTPSALGAALSDWKVKQGIS
jgi:tRNA nucleotidyltransferase (CCA-adding enzyme)